MFKKIIILYLVTTNLFAAGMTVHMHMADVAIDQIKSPSLKKLLMNQRRIFRNGSIYPDSGYVGKNQYGEYSHWSDFHNQYLEKISKSCTWPLKGECREWVAHLFGCIAHSIGDVEFDRHFVRASSAHDFNGNYNKADSEISVTLDLLTIVQNKRGRVVPKKYVPYQFLNKVYEDEFRGNLVKEMKHGSRIQYLGLLGERIIAPFGALKAKKSSPWTYKNYMSARGGIIPAGIEIAKVLDQAWEVMESSELKTLPVFFHFGRWPDMNYGVKK